MRDPKEAAEFWNEKYKEDRYFFGTKPNAWVKTILDQLGNAHGKGLHLIELACGEGRNSNYAASLGYDVLATDVSERGLEKTQRLAEKNGHTIQTRRFDVLDTSDTLIQGFDVVVVTFLHFSKEQRPAFFQRLKELLSPKGHLIAEWYHPNQRNHGYTSGGPPSPEMMLELTELEETFNQKPWQIQELSYTLSVLDEGPGHSGLAALSRIHATKTPA